jgi:hypothetical protein
MKRRRLMKKTREGAKESWRKSGKIGKKKDKKEVGSGN